jgi:hypothetical protein
MAALCRDAATERRRRLKSLYKHGCGSMPHFMTREALKNAFGQKWDV